MFENEQTARFVLDRFLSLNGQVDDTIRMLEPQTSREEYRALKKAVGFVMYEVFDKVIEPICKHHPSLRPPQMTDEK